MIHRKILTIALAVLAAAAVAAPAVAAKAPRQIAAPPGGWGAAYERAAIEYWDAEAIGCDTKSVEWDSSLPATQGAIGLATLVTHLHTECQMWIAPMKGHGVFLRCIDYAHEYGHWLGHDDLPTDDPRSVASEYGGLFVIDPPCDALANSISPGWRHRVYHPPVTEVTVNENAFRQIEEEERRQRRKEFRRGEDLPRP